MKSIRIDPRALTRTFTMIMRHDTHYFLEHELPTYKSGLKEKPVRFARYFSSLRSGEYIAKAGYSEIETEYVYLTIGQFSGEKPDLSSLTFLENAVGEQYADRAITSDSLVITRSGTVGVAHVFRVEASDEKVYIPSHHLAIVTLPEDRKQHIEFLRLFLQSDFARAYFWAFASGKGQKEISNWSIKTLPIPQTEDPLALASDVLEVEEKIARLKLEIEAYKTHKERLLHEGVSRPGAFESE